MDNDKGKKDPPGYKCWMGFAPKAKKYYRVCKSLEELDAIKRKTASRMVEKVKKEGPDMSKAVSRRLMECPTLTKAEKQGFLKAVGDKKQLLKGLGKMAKKDEPKPKKDEPKKNVVENLKKEILKMKTLKSAAKVAGEEDMTKWIKLTEERFDKVDEPDPKKIAEELKKEILKVKLKKGQKKMRETEPKPKKEKKDTEEEEILKRFKMDKELIATDTDINGKQHKSKDVKGGRCVPFIYKGQIQTKPIKGKLGNWCATSVTEKGLKKTWGYVKEEKPEQKDILEGISGDRKQKAKDIKAVLESTRGKDAEFWVNEELDDIIGAHPYITWEDMKDLSRFGGSNVPSRFWLEDKYRRAVRNLIIKEYAKAGIVLERKKKS